MRIKLYILFFIFFTSAYSYAQSQVKAKKLQKSTVKATVIGKKDKLPVIGATVLIKGTYQGCSCDIDGAFKIDAFKNDTLVISAIGYESKLIPLHAGLPAMIHLEPASIEMDEVMVVGYGTTEKRDLTGSVSSIKAKSMDKQALSFDNAIAGRVAGVNIGMSSGMPGSASAITIRGISSLNSAANSPLIVIDGVPVYGTGGAFNKISTDGGSIAAVGISGGSVSQVTAPSEFERNPLASLNPEDIESIEILKDAFSTAIYGSRGAAGVILITTKRGKKGRTEVQVDYSSSVGSPIGKHDLMTGDQYVDFYNKYFTESKQPSEKFVSMGNTNWYEEIIRPAFTHKVDASVSGGSDKSTYFISGSYVDQDAYIINQDLKRYSGRVNLDNRPNDKFKFGLNIGLTYNVNNALNAPKVYADALLASPAMKVKNENGDYSYYRKKSSTENVNPVAYAKENTSTLEDLRTVGNLYGELKPFEWLTFRSELGVDFYNSKSYLRIVGTETELDYRGKTLATPNIAGNTASESVALNQKFVINNYATIRHQINKHLFNTVLGQSFENSKEYRSQIFGNNFPDNSVKSIGVLGSSDKGVNDAGTQYWALASYFARFNYQYDQRYLFGVTYRIDGSSKFSKNNRYIGFPSVSAGWRVSEENFMKNISQIDQLKFRASLGFSGSDGANGYYGSQGTFVYHYLNGYAGQSYIYTKEPSNPNLKWERTVSLDLGMDLTLFNNRIDIVLDYYNKRINNALNTTAIPFYMYHSSIKQNIGDLRNYGYEFTLNTTNIDRDDFMWVTTFNMAHNTSKVISLSTDDELPATAENGYVYMREGEEIGLFYLYDYVGVDPESGNPLWRLNDGTVTTEAPASRDDKDYQKVVAGSAQPKLFGGITNVITYKNWELNMFFSYSIGNKMLNATKANLYTYSSKYNNLSTDMLDYWKLLGHQTSIPALVNESMTPGGTDYMSSTESTRFLEDADYLRLKTLKLTYRFDKDFLKRISPNLHTLNVYFSGTNLLTFTKYSGIDPEVSAFGSNALAAGKDILTMPQAKTYQIGVRIGF